MIFSLKSKLKFTLFLTVLACTLISCQVPRLPGLLPGKNVIQEILLNIPEASEVYLVWGINGWKNVSPNIRPDGTFIRDSLMYSPMVRNGDEFRVSLQVPDGALIDFGFLLTRDKSGNPIQVWVADGEQDFHVTAEKNGVFTHNQAELVIAEPQASQVEQSPPAKWVINYSLPGAKEVSLVWGIDGWKNLSSQLQPEGTYIQDGVMITPLVKNGKIFTIALTIPRNVELDYRFLVSGSQNGKQVERWDPSEGDGYHNQVQKDGVATIESWMQLNQVKDSMRIMVAGLYLLIGLVLVVIVGIIFHR